MFATPASPDLDLSQKNILHKLHILNKALDREVKLDPSYCAGFAAVVIRAFKNTLHPDPATDPPEDLTWFNNLLILIATWDEKTSFSTKQLAAIDRFFSLVNKYQHIAKHARVGQGELDKVEPGIYREYSLAGPFVPEDFSKTVVSVGGEAKEETAPCAILDILFKNNKATLITSHDHDLVIFKWKESFWFYDSNHPQGMLTFSKDKANALVLSLFNAFFGRADKPSPFGFRLFGFETEAAVYPSRRTFLKELKIYQEKSIAKMDVSHASGYSVLRAAAFINCLESVAYCLEEGANVNQIAYDKAAPIYMASQFGYDSIIRKLLEYKAEVNLTAMNGASPLHVAAQKGYLSTVQLLLAYKADPKKNVNRWMDSNFVSRNRQTY